MPDKKIDAIPFYGGAANPLNKTETFTKASCAGDSIQYRDHECGDEDDEVNFLVKACFGLPSMGARWDFISA